MSAADIMMAASDFSPHSHICAPSPAMSRKPVKKGRCQEKTTTATRNMPVKNSMMI
ncbi:MAG: hypothetical protein JRJ85_25380 [Deltaproteobacteria bacterium]|nr:hypothetical protein [Deltaproteobacteria bacterium]